MIMVEWSHGSNTIDTAFTVLGLLVTRSTSHYEALVLRSWYVFFMYDPNFNSTILDVTKVKLVYI